jgi:hypothetical protein
MKMYSIKYYLYEFKSLVNINIFDYRLSTLLSYFVASVFLKTINLKLY